MEYKDQFILKGYMHILTFSLVLGFHIILKFINITSVALRLLGCHKVLAL